MGTKWFWSLLIMLVMALSMVSCGSDDDEKKDDDGGEGGTTITTEYTATTEVKEVKLKALAAWDNPYCTIYEDFNYKHILVLSNGLISLYSYRRENGSWKRSVYYAHVKDLGKMDGIKDITERNESYDDSLTNSAQPEHGYAMNFKTENNEWKYLRVYIKGYTLDKVGALSSITVQYQLY